MYYLLLQVLKNNYLMIGIDGSIAQNGTDWFNYHSTSDSLLAIGPHSLLKVAPDSYVPNKATNL
jgi:hypothetical protein